MLPLSVYKFCEKVGNTETAHGTGFPLSVLCGTHLVLPMKKGFTEIILNVKKYVWSLQSTLQSCFKYFSYVLK